MAVAVKSGQGIEGLQIKGHSRRPIINRGLTKKNQTEVNKFVANHNCKSEIETALNGSEKCLCSKAFKATGDKANAEQLSIYSVSSKFNEIVTATSGRHQANHWTFKKQTLAEISKPDQNLINSIANSAKKKNKKKNKK